MTKRVIIIGAAGRDFHNFNTIFRDDPSFEVIAFTHGQISDIAARHYPAELAGKLYSQGIPIYPEIELDSLIKKYKIDHVIFSYSDVTYQNVMHLSSITSSAGADFLILSTEKTMLKSNKPVVSVCAVRTGSGKSQTTRKVCSILQNYGLNPVVVRHPMPYGDLHSQVNQRFARYEDFDYHKITIEEREEYEHLVENDIVVYAGVDYSEILQSVEKEADVIVWDGGNNDTPFFKPDVHIVLFDPHRPGHELLYYPGETNMLMADIAVINKVKTATHKNIKLVRNNIETHAPDAEIILAESKIIVDNPESIQNKKVLVIEDGPTLTHGEMPYGAAHIAAGIFKASEIINPAPYSVGTIKDVYKRFSHLENVLPCMGYSNEQIKDLENTINKADCELVLYATPINLEKLISINKPALRVRYEYKDYSEPHLEDILLNMIKKKSQIVDAGKKSVKL